MTETPSIDHSSAQKIVLEVGDLAFTADKNSVLSTYGLGSCVGIAAYCPEKALGALLHIMLPDSKTNPTKAEEQPATFADTGLAALFQEFESRGSTLKQVHFFLAGGASFMGADALFKIGEKNIEAVKAIFQAQQITPVDEQLGGINNRTLHLFNGMLELQTPSTKTTFSLK